MFNADTLCRHDLDRILCGHCSPGLTREQRRVSHPGIPLRARVTTNKTVNINAEVVIEAHTMRSERIVRNAINGLTMALEIEELAPYCLRDLSKLQQNAIASALAWLDVCIDDEEDE